MKEKIVNSKQIAADKSACIDLPHGQLSPEIHTSYRTRDQWAPAQCHNRLQESRKKGMGQVLVISSTTKGHYHCCLVSSLQ